MSKPLPTLCLSKVKLPTLYAFTLSTRHVISYHRRKQVTLMLFVLQKSTLALNSIKHLQLFDYLFQYLPEIKVRLTGPQFSHSSFSHFKRGSLHLEFSSFMETLLLSTKEEEENSY